MENKTTKCAEPSEEQLQRLAKDAWAARDRAYVVGTTKVGCTVLCADGAIYSGCNVEHKYRCHDVHAEVNAITTMVGAGGAREIRAIVIAAARERFTPCGGCMDWIMQFAENGSCIIAIQSEPGGPLKCFTAGQLMPFYPK
jgi:cytidine deaminase